MSAFEYDSFGAQAGGSLAVGCHDGKHRYHAWIVPGEPFPEIIYKNAVDKNAPYRAARQLNSCAAANRALRAFLAEHVERAMLESNAELDARRAEHDRQAAAAAAKQRLEDAAPALLAALKLALDGIGQARRPEWDQHATVTAIVAAINEAEAAA